ncbi:hypothetical protein FA13DRAFT_1806360 [Coprinellus micaceus]|uniref:Uncharacterized protein n=1 Tax=Coprinellus micaceus TaxID=71717 RepID=A0A4Y7RNK6_COPMI|nr:hypothetical protein FA13DRAFT_1806360 [Coprinellus micaceus]
MSAGDEPAPGIVGVATSGIQDVSALLPLLGTGQCETLVSSALERGFLYAAATLMSIFGSLGIVKAGFIVLWGSIDHRIFRGPTLLENAGIKPTGVRKLLVPVETDNATDKGRLYVAEDKLFHHLSNIRIHSVAVRLFSKDLWWWNLSLVGTTALLSSLGLLPYIYLITGTLSDAPFEKTWPYPVLRIEVYYRLRFLAADRHLETTTQSAVPSFWDSSGNAKSVLARLRRRPLERDGNGAKESDRRFTKSLLEVLTSPDYSKYFPTMTYKQLVESINSGKSKA